MRGLGPALISVLLASSTISAHAQLRTYPNPTSSAAKLKPSTVPPATGGGPPAAPATFTPAANLTVTSLTLPNLAGEGSPAVTLQVSGLKSVPTPTGPKETAPPPSWKKPPVDITVADAGQPADGQTKVSATPGDFCMDVTGDVAMTTVTLAISKMPPNTALDRKLLVTVGGRVIGVDYKLSNKPPVEFTWTPHVSTQFFGAPGQAVPLALSVGTISATSVKIGPSLQLFDQGAGAASPSMYLNGSSACAEASADPITAPANSTSGLWLVRGCDESVPAFWCFLNSSCWFGHYKGSFLITSTEKPAGDLVNLDISTTDWPIRLVGAVLLVIGVAISFVATQFGQWRINRLGLRHSLAVQRDDFAALLGELQASSATMPETEKKLAALIADRVDAKVRSLSDDKMNDLSKDGMAWQNFIVALIHAAVPRASRESNADRIITSLDELSAQATVPTSQQIEFVFVGKTASSLVGMLGLRPAMAFLATGTATLRSMVGMRPRSKSPTELMIAINFWNLVGFLFLTISTAAVGFYNLVWTSSFGTNQDLFSCLLWGLGLPIGTKAVTTIASLATTLGIKLSLT